MNGQKLMTLLRVTASIQTRYHLLSSIISEEQTQEDALFALENPTVIAHNNALLQSEDRAFHAAG